MAKTGDTKDKSMATYFTKLWTTSGTTYRAVATEMNKTPYRMSNGKNWDGQNVSYYAQKILGLKGIREYAKSTGKTTTTTKKAKTTTKTDDWFATDDVATSIINSGLPTGHKLEIVKTLYGVTQ